MTTQAEVRESFWLNHLRFADERRLHKRQNDYRCDIRAAFVEYVDSLQKSGVISEALAERVTL